MTTSVDAPASAGLRSYDASAILSMLPHRWPFLLIDGAFDVDPGRSGKGVKNVSLAEPYFAGHFPGDPIVPGVLIIEALAQLTAIVYVAQAQESGHPAPASTVGYLGAINRVKFHRVVRPGERLDLAVTLTTALGDLRTVDIAAHVGREKVVTGTITVSNRAGER
ncbi:hypothetical protein AXK57_07600 [Tsukamurella pulmonis]|uniref:3-hydroxyacyl-[acyl-carrier-protein] dehydratase n=1 Tax=Tsukamurella pulmonis TaxID=47312 RepID=A0A1H1CCV5_9ACTN|nr:3-hydroxyacyl-ACP dehydratase FabZ [Tsukamurella pulmonis]KXO89957.1 hypothetical protein AXK56_07355 [Tsukamurella pulmonis]KXP11213.1 hypothetical protein AXK57_07600 [Tsukamurella pulmonis]RDH13198.1 beta-hydroxyacyl-ACP dehydratase [Tsukamurella pulmonis]SDQ62031.1 3-hydroxyacyl-[acyl-carrier-protein] dehydratase [Tsukamurella pulmonis]SUP23869.1 (3R)-hydroxymyristoyl-[acyl-carrier-protein] dehydratase [Tsukamurella pulmonis]